MYINQDRQITEVSIYELKELQGKLKKTGREAYEKFRDRILAEGFKYLFYFWQNDQGEKYIIDGHHRKKFLLKMADEGIAIPEFYPALRIEARDKKEAVKELLFLNSTYGEVTKHGLKELLKGYNLKPLELKGVHLVPKNVSLVKTFREMEREEQGKSEGDNELPEFNLELTSPGDLWELGGHRLLCGDSTLPGDVTRLMGGEQAVVIQADPPYGMDKSFDNDNLKGGRLTEFHRSWLAAASPHLVPWSCVYIWGVPEELWALWHSENFRDDKTYLNHLVWDKGGVGTGQKSETVKSYLNINEHCFFYTNGLVKAHNNLEDYWEGWDPIRLYIKEEVTKMGWKIKDTKRIAGHKENSRDHWMARSQWEFISEEVYTRFQVEAAGQAFPKSYDELRAEYEKLKEQYWLEHGGGLGFQHHFDNTHEAMSDVWSFPPVNSNNPERYGHPTVKPVELMERIVKTSSREGDTILVPFGGSGPDLIAAEKHNRRAYLMELEPGYCNIIVIRWLRWMVNNNREIGPVRLNGQEFDWKGVIDG